MRKRVSIVAGGALVAIAGAALAGGARNDEPSEATIAVETSRKDCAVELDATSLGKTDGQGRLIYGEVEPGDHYVHITCPGAEPEHFFIAPRAGETANLRPGQPAASGAAANPSPLDAGETRQQLRQLIQEAIQLRARGRLEDAATRLRDATRLDPENSDLHRELGITFLLGKEWKRARVEMLEALRHDPTDADAHNGLGYALEKLGNLDAALNEFRTAMRLEPDDPTYREHYFQALARISERLAAEKAKGKSK